MVPPAPRAPWSPWRSVTWFGLVSLCADMVYEGMRSVAGPFLGELGASALTVGVVTGAGEAVALVLRLASGPWADRSGRHWRLAVIGYVLTAVCVPLLAFAPLLGVAGVGFASAMILLERTGKAIRSPAKSALLARMTAATGRGKGFGVHKALDQVGAVSGPLVVAGVVLVSGTTSIGLAVLAVPGVVSLLLLAQLRRGVPSLAAPEPAGEAHQQLPARLPAQFHRFSLAAAGTTAGLMTFGVISLQMVDDGVFSVGLVPVVYAAAMAAGAVAALGSGALFDRWSGRVLLAVPVLVAVVPLLVFDDRAWVALVGVVVWGAATGVQDSTVKAYVADLVAPARRATAYGVFAAVQGTGALAGGVLAGALVVDRPGTLSAVIGLVQLGSLAVLTTTLRRPAPNT